MDQEVVQAFGTLGLTVNPSMVDFNTLLSHYSTKGKFPAHNFFMIVGWVASTERTDPQFWLYDVGADSNSNRDVTFYSNPQYDSLVEQQAVELDPAKRLALVKQAQQVHANDFPFWRTEGDVWNNLYDTRRVTNLKSAKAVGVSPYAFFPLLNVQLVQGTEQISPYLRAGATQSDTNLNILAASDANTRAFLRLLYDTFVRMDTDQGQAVPWAASAWNWVDSKTIDLTLRDGMKWHDGQAVTIDDAKFTFDFALAGNFPQWASMISNISSTQTTDSKTLRIILKSPSAAFVNQNLVFLPILPKHIWQNVTDPLNWDPSANNGLIGSGPFKFDHWKRTQEWLFLANSQHWNPPKVNGILKIEFASMDGMMGALQTGAIDFDWLDPAPVSSVQSLTAQYSWIGVLKSAQIGTRMIYWDLTQKPFSDKAFRKALYYVFPFKDFVDVARQGAGTTGGLGPIPDSLTGWYDATIPAPKYDLAGAKKILSDAGYGWDSQGALHYPPE